MTRGARRRRRIGRDPGRVHRTMHLQGELTLDYKTYRQIVRAPAGRRLLYLRVIGALSLAAGVVSAVTGSSIGDYAPAMLVGVLLVFLTDLALPLSWRRMTAMVATPWRYEISDDAVGIHSPQTDVSVRWDAIAKAKITEHAWVFRLAATKRSIVVPRSAFSEGERRQADAFITARSPE